MRNLLPIIGVIKPKAKHFRVVEAKPKAHVDCKLGSLVALIVVS